ncbi:MAG: 7-cyano-7-deazaguanine reductase, partial [Candidatus Cloacimonetes bacterium]|nr:7-cyano-7-deazaguanine reductase [Candidatus Cloacimonadota bacterium]
NMSVFDNSKKAIKTIKDDLRLALKTSKIKIYISTFGDFNQKFNPPAGGSKKFKCIDNLNSNNSFQYKVNANLLHTMPKVKSEHFLMSNLLKSNCPITNQPDWSTVYIYYFADKKEIIEESLLHYIVSYRNHNEFHEECCERILFDLVNKIQPKKIVVLCKYNRRGGIDINPLRVYPREEIFIKNLPIQIKEILYLREFRQ